MSKGCNEAELPQVAVCQLAVIIVGLGSGGESYPK